MSLPTRRALAAGAGLALALSCLTAAGAQGAATVKDDACTASTARAKTYVLHPKTVHSTKTATCVLKYANQLTFSDGLTTSVGLRYRSLSHYEYQDSGDGDDTLTYESRYFAGTHAALTVSDDHHEQDGWSYPDAEQYDTVTMQYADPTADELYTIVPNTGAAWTKETLSTATTSVPLLGTHWFPATKSIVTKWSHSTASGLTTWKFTLKVGTVRLVFDRTGRLVSGSRSLSYDGGQHTESVSMILVYGDDVPLVQIPTAVKNAAAAG